MTGCKPARRTNLTAGSFEHSTYIRRRCAAFPTASLHKRRLRRFSHFSRLRFDEAKGYMANRATLATLPDAEVSYYLGIAYDGLGEIQPAQAAYEQALRLPEFRSAAALRLR